jgi:hypothetical protein
LWFVLAGLTFICLPVLTSVSWWVVAVLIVLAMIVVLPIWLVMRRGRRGRTTGRSYFTGSLALTMLLICAAGLPIYYLAYRTEADPMVLPLITLTNGTKTVVFQGMVHIGSESFYKSVVYDLESALADGYSLVLRRRAASRS